MPGTGLKNIFAAGILILAGAGCIRSGDVMIPLPMVPFVPLIDRLNQGKVVATCGKPLENYGGGGWRYGVSDHFGTNDLRQLSELLNSAAFQAPLTNFSCGDPVPKFTFQVTLVKEQQSTTDCLSVYWAYVPRLKLRDHGVEEGLFYLTIKGFASIEAARRPESPFRKWWKPHVDCSKRPAVGVVPPDGYSWVTYSEPEEMFW